MGEKRASKEVSKEIAEMIINTKPEDITSTLVLDLFGEFDGKCKCNTYDTLTVPPGKYGVADTKRGLNKNSFKTTIGKLIFNKMFIERNPSIFDHFGWINDTITKKVFGKINQELCYLRLEYKVPLEEYKRFLLTSQLTMPYVQFLTPTYTDEMLLCSREINKKKAKLLKENKAALDKGDLIAQDKIQKELLDYSKELMKDDPSMDTFNSGGGGDFENNFKNMFVIKGTVRDPDPNKGYNFITSNYIDGISADEYNAFANTLAEGPYSRGKKTEVGGYWEKLLLYSLQHVSIGPPNSDCKTKRFIKVYLTDKNIKYYMYSYVIDGSKLVELTLDTRDKYMNKSVKIRFSSLCEMKGCFCSKCAGNLWYRMGITNVGLVVPQIASTIKNLMMKAFHDSQVKLTDMDVMDAFLPDNKVLNEDAILDEANPFV